MTSSDRCDRILALIDACLDEVTQASAAHRPPGVIRAGAHQLQAAPWARSQFELASRPDVPRIKAGVAGRATF
jgi:hypothetical protein